MLFASTFLFTPLAGTHTCLVVEVAAEHSRVREAQLVGYLCYIAHRQLRRLLITRLHGSEQVLRLCNQVVINTLFRALACSFPYAGGEILGRDKEFVCIKLHTMLLVHVLPKERKELLCEFMLARRMLYIKHLRMVIVVESEKIGTHEMLKSGQTNGSVGLQHAFAHGKQIPD